MIINYGLTKSGLTFKFKEQLKEIDKLKNWSKYELIQFSNIFFDFLQNLILVKALNIMVKYVSYLIDKKRKFLVYTSFDGFKLDESTSDLLVSFDYNKIDLYKYKYSLSLKNKRKRRQTTLVLYSKDRDKQKELRAFKANYIHHIDSIIVYSVIYKLMEKKIKICVIHDCFGISLKDIEQFNIIYRECLINLFQKDNNFLNWLKYLFQKDIINNNELLNSLLKELIELQDKNKNDEILKEITNSFYIIFP